MFKVSSVWCFILSSVPRVQFISFLFLVRRKILSILDSIDFSQEIPEPLQLDFFDRAQIEQVIANCEHKNLRGQTICNVKVRVPSKNVSSCASDFHCRESVIVCVCIFILPWN